MIRRLPVIFLIATTMSVANAHDGEIGVDLTKTARDVDATTRTFFATGHLPLRNNIQGELSAELSDTNFDGTPDQDSSRFGFGLYSIQKKATFGMRVNAISTKTESAFGNNDENSTRLDFDASVSVKPGLANFGISRYSSDNSSNDTRLFGGLDLFPRPKNMVSIEGMTSSDIKAIGVQYLITPINTLGLSAKYVYVTDDSGVAEAKSNIVSISAQYYFDEGGIKKKIDRLKARKIFWQSILR